MVIQLEKVPKDTKLEDFRRRESSWIQRLDTLRRGYNSRREMAKRQAPLLPVYGLGPAPIKRSRNADRDTKFANKRRIDLRMDFVEPCICSIFYKINQMKLTKSGRSIVLTTDASCLGNTHAQAVFELQAGFRPGFAPCLPGESYQNTIIFSVIDHSKY